MRLSIAWLRGVLSQGLLGFVALSALAETAGATPVAVNWITVNGTVVAGSTLSRLGGTGFSDTAVGSLALISGPGQLEFSTTETDRAKAAGLGSRDNNSGLQAIDFGFLLRADGTAAVIEKGAAVQSAGTYSAGDVFRVAVEGSAIVFRVNGSLVRTSALALTYPLFAEATLADPGATISNAELDGTVAKPVVWAGAVKTNASPGFLSKTTSAIAWDASAISTMAIGPETDGYLEVSASLSPNLVMVGLSNGNTNSGYSDIDYALYMSSGTLYIYEGGTNRGSFGTFASSDKLRVSIESGVVKYRKNGTPVYTSLVTPTFPLLVDSSLYSSGARLTGAVLSGTLVQAAVSTPTFSSGSGLYPTAQTVTVTGETGSTIHYTTNGSEPTEADPVIASGSSLLIDVDATLKAKAWETGVYPSSTATAWYVFGTPTLENVDWTAHVNAASTGNLLSKTTGVVAWDAGAISTKGLGSPDGYLEVSASVGANLAMVGLSYGNTNSGYSDIDYALYFSSGTLYIYEGGLNRGSFGTVVAADKLRVSVEGGVVRYRKNGTLLYTSALAPAYPLLVDSSLYSSGATLQGAILSGTLVTAAVQNPAFSVPSGIFSTAFDVVVTGPFGSAIHYTTTGLDPTEADATVASGSSLLIDVTTTLKAKAFAAGLIPSGTTAAIYQFGAVSTEDVVWTAQVNASSSGNTLTKNTSVVAWDASAISTKGIISPGGYLEVSASLSPNLVMVGLSHGNTNSGYSDIDYALYLSSGTLYIYEGGINRGSFGTMVAADKLRVSVESGVVRYRKNGNLIYTSALAPSYPLLVDTSLYSSGARLLGAVISGNLVQVAASRPVFSPGSGLYATPQDVVVTAEAGSTVHYTTDGAEPTEADNVIASGASLLIDADTTLKARAWAIGLYPSGTTSALYELGTATTENVVWTAHLNTTSTGNTLSKSVSTTAWDASAVSSKAIDSPDGYLEVNASLSPKAAMVGLANGNTNSGYPDIDYALYMASGTLYVYEAGLNRGSFGALVAADKLRVSVEAGVVKYRKNGALLYTSPLAPTYPLLVDTSLYSTTAAIQSAVLSGRLVNSKTSPPTASPEAGGYALPIDVALSADLGATIRYTTNGSDPTAASTLYTTSINVASPTTIKARAFKVGYLDSDASIHAYINLPPSVAPTFTPSAGPYLGPLLVAVTTTTPGALIHYTFEGADPTLASPSVASGGAIAIPTSGTLKGITVASGYANSSIASAMYELVAPQPTLSPNGGSFNGPVQVTLSAGPGATIHYTTNGAVPDSNSPAYATPFTLSASATVKARAFVAGWTPSSVGSAAFTVISEAAAPTFSPAQGFYSTTQNVTLTCATPGATIYYTTDGTDPTTASSTYVAPLAVASPTRIKARAFGAGLTPSTISSGQYDVVSFNQRLWVNSGSVVLLDTAGQAWAWGSNLTAQLGLGAAPVPLPVRAPIFDQARDLSSWDHTVWLDASGALRVLGADDFGQATGIPGPIVTTPTALTGVPSLRKVRAGNRHTLALADDGTVWVWGDNSSGQHGFGHQDESPGPSQVPGLAGIVDIQTYYDGLVALRSDGRVFAWGAGDSLLTSPTQVSPLPALKGLNQGFGPFAGVDEQGHVWVLGYSQWSQDATPALLPASVECVDGVATLAAAFTGVKEIRGHFLALESGAFRYLFDGPCGGGDGAHETTRAAPATTGSIVAAASKVSDTYVMVTDAGEVWTWGWDNLGDGVVGGRPNDPQVITGNAYIFQARPPHFSPDSSSGPFEESINVEILSDVPNAAIYYTTDGGAPDASSNQYVGPIAVTTLATLKARAFVSGLSPSRVASAQYVVRPAAPTISPAGRPANRPTTVQVSCPDSDQTTVRYTLDGSEPFAGSQTLACGGSVQVPPATTITAVAVRGGAQSTSVHETFGRIGTVAAGPGHYLMVVGDGSVFAWGANSHGELGDGTTTDRPIPTLALFNSARSVAAGSTHSLGVYADATVWSWGGNASGQLGDGTLQARPSPAVVPGLTDIVAVAAGDGHSLALAEDGTVWAWGSNAFGQLGDGTQQSSLVPAQVPGLTSITAIAAGLNHSLALAADGRVWAWGRNSHGQLGDGTLIDRSVPVAVLPFAEPGASAIAAGDEHSLAMAANGEMMGWGASWGVVPTPASVDTSNGDGFDRTSMTGVSVLDGGQSHTVTRAAVADLANGGGPVGGLFSWSGDALQVGAGNCLGCGPDAVSILDDVADPIIEISAFGSHNIATSLSRSVWTWETDSTTTGDPSEVVGTDGRRALAPVFSLPSGTFRTEQFVTITAPNPGATIYYTLDGTPPGPGSAPLVSGGVVQIIQSAELRAISVAGALLPSDVRHATYYLRTQDPNLSPAPSSIDSTTAVVVTSVDPLAVIHYNLSAWASPLDPTVPSGTPVNVPPNSYLFIVAERPGWQPSNVQGGYYRLGVAKPTIDPPGGTFIGPVEVTLTTTTPDAIIWYRSATSYAGYAGTNEYVGVPSGTRILISESQDLEISATKAGLPDSDGASATFAFQIAAPTLIVEGTAASAPFMVYGASKTKEAVVRCSLDGSEPTEESPICTTGIAIEQSTVVKARAFRIGSVPSTTTERSFSIASAAVHAPVFDLKAGRYATARAVSVTTTTAGAEVHYRTDGLEPTLSDPVITAGNPVTLDRSMRISAKAWLGASASLTSRSDFLITGQVAVAGPGDFTLALKTDGALWGWGNGAGGRLGMDLPDPSPALPITQLPISDVRQIAVGSTHTVALRNDGTVWVWGANEFGQLGLPGLSHSGHAYNPTDIGLSQIVSVVAGYGFSAALRNDGSVWWWGAYPAGTDTPSLAPSLSCLRIYVDYYGFYCAAPDGSTTFGSTESRGLLPGFLPIPGAGDIEGHTGRPGYHAIDIAPGVVLTKGGIALDWLLSEGRPVPILSLPPIVAVVPNGLVSATGQIYSIPHSPQGSATEIAGLRLHTFDWGEQDADYDGLKNAAEVLLGTDPYHPDTNRDGVSDGDSVTLGIDPISRDRDGDGVSNSGELLAGTAVDRADTDGDGVIDGLDAFPLDPTRSAPPSPTTGDTQPPIIVLRTPTGATLISSVPGGIE